MNTPDKRQSAQIYQFPIGGRGAASSRAVTVGAALHTDVADIAPVECGSGWYHEAAIRQTDPSRKH